MTLTEYRAQSTEYRVQSTEYRVQSTEYRVQSTEYFHITIPSVVVFMVMSESKDRADSVSESPFVRLACLQSERRGRRCPCVSLTELGFYRLMASTQSSTTGNNVGTSSSFRDILAPG